MHTRTADAVMSRTALVRPGAICAGPYCEWPHRRAAPLHPGQRHDPLAPHHRRHEEGDVRRRRR
eukprot:6195611-Pleurochrysis_carterae.AAC.2